MFNKKKVKNIVYLFFKNSIFCSNTLNHFSTIKISSFFFFKRVSQKNTIPAEIIRPTDVTLLFQVFEINRKLPLLLRGESPIFAQPLFQILFQNSLILIRFLCCLYSNFLSNILCLSFFSFPFSFLFLSLIHI